MAKLKTLADCIEKVLRPIDAKMNNYVEQLRLVGMLSTGPRGTNAPDMTVTDAVNLLLAPECSNRAKDAPISVKLYRDLVPCSYGTAMIRDPFFNFLTEHHLTFGQALEMLIERSKSGALGRWLPATHNDSCGVIKYPCDLIAVEISKPRPWARIMFGEDDTLVEFSQRNEHGIFADGRTIKRFTHRTIHAIGEVLNS